MTSYIRGRELKGVKFPVPQGMVGTIVRKNTETGKLCMFIYVSPLQCYS